MKKYDIHFPMYNMTFHSIEATSPGNAAEIAAPMFNEDGDYTLSCVGSAVVEVTEQSSGEVSKYEVMAETSITYVVMPVTP